MSYSSPSFLPVSKYTRVGCRMNACECGHNPDAHYGGVGACEQFDGDFPCSCPRYEWQGDQ